MKSLLNLNTNCGVMGSYKLSDEAKIALVRIHQHGVRQFGEAQADEYYFSLIERFEQIAEHPFLYPAVNHIREGYRRSVCGVDSIYYRIKGEQVEIMNILGRQDTDDTL